jgi:peptidoglycan hydrolase-like protein with peptidoglycan-binding domain
MSIFSTITDLVRDYQLWQKYQPMVNEIEAVLLKHGIDVNSSLTKTAPADGLVKDIQAKLNEQGAHPPLGVDGVMGEMTLNAILSQLRGKR